MLSLLIYTLEQSWLIQQKQQQIPYMQAIIRDNNNLVPPYIMNSEMRSFPDFSGEHISYASFPGEEYLRKLFRKKGHQECLTTCVINDFVVTNIELIMLLLIAASLISNRGLHYAYSKK